jgi:uncharacterized membrane protein (DUF441 family)
MMKNIRQQLKSKTVRKDLALLASAGVAYLAANPAIVAAYGPGAVAAFAILGIYLRNKTDRAVKDIE